jgi:uncharacterized protein (DUF4415 family)
MRKERIVSYSLDDIRKRLARGEGKSDWAKVDAMTDAEIEAQMRDDPDWADFVDVDWSTAAIVYPEPKSAISIRLDKDVLEFFKETGKGYQSRINAVLRHYMQETVRSRKSR